MRSTENWILVVLWFALFPVQICSPFFSVCTFFGQTLRPVWLAGFFFPLTTSRRLGFVGVLLKSVYLPLWTGPKGLIVRQRFRTQTRIKTLPNRNAIYAWDVYIYCGGIINKTFQSRVLWYSMSSRWVILLSIVAFNMCYPILCLLWQLTRPEGPPSRMIGGSYFVLFLHSIFVLSWDIILAFWFLEGAETCINTETWYSHICLRLCKMMYRNEFHFAEVVYCVLLRFLYHVYTGWFN